MDRLLVDVAGITRSLEQILARYSTSASSTLFLIKAQIQCLDGIVDSIRLWLHDTDAMSSAQAVRRLFDSSTVVNAAVGRLWYDLNAIAHSRVVMEFSQAATTGFAFDETRIRLHLCDISECVSLMQLAYTAGQSVDSDSHAADELALAARILQRTHNTSPPERRMVILDNIPLSMSQYSTHFNNFVEAILSAEGNLLRSDASGRTTATRLRSERSARSPSEGVVQTRLDQTHDDQSAASAGMSATPVEGSRDRAHGSDEDEPGTLSRRSSSSSLLTTDSSWRHSTAATDATLPASPRAQRLSESIRETPTGTQRQLPRKPVRPPARSPTSSTSMTVPAAVSTTNLRQRDALVAIASRTSPTDVRTSHLFREASGSLSSLADNLSQVHQEPIESPPPYPSARVPTTVATTTNPDEYTTLSSGSSSAEIFRAIQDNRTNALRNLVERGSRVDITDSLTSRTPLMQAAALQRSEAVHILLDAGVRAHLKDPRGWTALHFAALEGDVRCCVLLLEAGAQLDEYNTNGETPLQLAARGGHTDAVRCLLGSWTTQNGSRQAITRAFCEATKSGNVSTAKAFVDHGIRPKNIDEPWTPVTCAAESGSIPMLDFMLQHGCSLKDRSADGWTAIHYAARNGNSSMVEKLLALKLSWKAQTKKTDETALHLATSAGHTSTALMLIAHKDANITMKDSDGQQALHHAVRNGDLTLATALLSKGARIDEPNAYGWQPIHLAAAYGHLTLVADFLTRGVSIEGKLAASSFKPRQRTNDAARRGFWAEIRWPHVGARPLHLALEFGHDDMANVLLASGARLDAADSHDWRPLHYAAFNCRPVMVEALLANGANPHITTDDNYTPLALEFRRSGLFATDEDKQHIQGLLQSAMDSKKKSKLKVLSTMLSGSSSRSRTAEGRNRAWHTAELASALYQDYEAQTPLDEGDSQFGYSEFSYQQTQSDTQTQGGQA